MSTLKQVTDQSFETDVIQASQPVLVDFWAPWCGPCKAIAPVLEDMAKTYDGKVQIVKMDVDQNAMTPPRFNVRGIPMLILFKEGEVAASHVGLLSANDLKRFIDENM